MSAALMVAVRLVTLLNVVLRLFPFHRTCEFGPDCPGPLNPDPVTDKEKPALPATAEFGLILWIVCAPAGIAEQTAATNAPRHTTVARALRIPIRLILSVRSSETSGTKAMLRRDYR